MRFGYKTINLSDEPRTYFEAARAQSFCCSFLSAAFHREQISFISFDDRMYCNIYLGNRNAYAIDPIRLCPFCGERIELVNVGTVRRVRKVKTVTETITRQEFQWEEVSE